MMDRRSEVHQDVVTIVSEPGALTFCTRKEWYELSDTFLGELTHHETVLVFMGTGAVFFLLRNMYPIGHLRDLMDEIENRYRLVKVVMDEEGKQKFFVMYLSRAEADQLMRNRFTIWE